MFDVQAVRFFGSDFLNFLPSHLLLFAVCVGPWLTSCIPTFPPAHFLTFTPAHFLPFSLSPLLTCSPAHFHPCTFVDVRRSFFPPTTIQHLASRIQYLVSTIQHLESSIQFHLMLPRLNRQFNNSSNIRTLFNGPVNNAEIGAPLNILPFGFPFGNRDHPFG